MIFTKLGDVKKKTLINHLFKLSLLRRLMRAGHAEHAGHAGATGEK